MPNHTLNYYWQECHTVTLTRKLGIEWPSVSVSHHQCLLLVAPPPLAFSLWPPKPGFLSLLHLLLPLSPPPLLLSNVSDHLPFSLTSSFARFSSLSRSTNTHNQIMARIEVLSLLNFCSLSIQRRSPFPGATGSYNAVASPKGFASDPDQLKAARDDIKDLLKTTFCHPIMVYISPNINATVSRFAPISN